MSVSAHPEDCPCAAEGRLFWLAQRMDEVLAVVATCATRTWSDDWQQALESVQHDYEVWLDERTVKAHE